MHNCLKIGSNQLINVIKNYYTLSENTFKSSYSNGYLWKYKNDFWYILINLNFMVPVEAIPSVTIYLLK